MAVRLARAGTAKASSDVDLAVLCSPPLGTARFAIVDRLSGEVGCDVDVIDLSTAPPSLTWEIVTTGRLLVEHDERATEDFVRRALPGRRRRVAQPNDPPRADRARPRLDAMSVRPEVILARLAHPGAVLASLRRLRALRAAGDGASLHELAAERALHIAAEAIFDIGHHVRAGRGLPIPGAYRDVLPALAAQGVFCPASWPSDSRASPVCVACSCTTTCA